MANIITTEQALEVLEKHTTKTVVDRVLKNEYMDVKIFRYFNRLSTDTGFIELVISRFISKEKRINFLNSKTIGSTIYNEHEAETCFVSKEFDEQDLPGYIEVGYELSTGKYPLLVKLSDNEWLFVEEEPKKLEEGSELSATSIAERVNRGWSIKTWNKRGELRTFSSYSNEVVTSIDDAEVIKLTNNKADSTILEYVLYRRHNGNFIITEKSVQWSIAKTIA